MRADRLLSILLLLQSQGRLPARALAERLEVSERTIARDMEALSMAGVPVWAERGRRGGWMLEEGYRTDLIGLTEAELGSLVVASAAMPRGGGLGVSEAADRAVLKLLATLPAARRREAERAVAYLHVDPAGWRRSEEAAPHLPVLERALRLGVRAAISYERALDRSTVERVVDPLGLVAKGSAWYLVAAVDGQPRTYRASRVRAAIVLDEPAERPADFDLARWWAGSRAEYEAQLPSFHATVHVAPDALPRVRAGWRFGSLVAEGTVTADGWVTCQLRFDTIEVAVDAVLGLGPAVHVVEPHDLHERVLASARALLDAQP